jgi:DNA-binding transcriptional MocR family regulator
VSYSLPLTRTETIVRHLREEIVTGRLAPGTVIKDAELADRLGVSITPVREAIMQLSAEGLIDISPNRTRRVTDVSQKNALELIDVMCVLACAGVEWGVPNLTEADLARMRQRAISGAPGSTGTPRSSCCCNRAIRGLPSPATGRSTPRSGPSWNQARARRKASMRRAQIRCDSAHSGANTSAAW